MAENKKGFVLYADLIHTVNKMTNDKAGELFKHILSYVNDLNPKADDLLIELVFEGIKQQLKRDLRKYERICERNKINGAKGGRPKKPSGLSGNPEKPKKPDKDIDNDKDRDKDINNRMAEFKNSLQPFLDKYGSNMIDKFFNYWTEHNERGKKMRFEYAKNQPFNISRRLVTWHSRDHKTQKNEEQSTTLKFSRESEHLL